MNYYSQLGQDKFLDEFFEGKENGFFIDIGAHDGKSGSNSLFFEENRNWMGICVEPGTSEFEILCSFRKSFNMNVCVSDYDGESEFTYLEGYPNMLSGLTENYNTQHIRRINSEISSYGGTINRVIKTVMRLQSILDINNTYNVDFCSIDTEGSELSIVKSIDFEKTDIKVFAIENNYQTSEINDFLQTKGYILYRKLQWDDIFVKKSYLEEKAEKIK